LSAREMMFGTREEFVYDRCDVCQSIQISEIPSDEVLQRHYPVNYYSYQGDSARPSSIQTIKRWFEIRRDRHNAGIDSPIGALMSRIWEGTPAVKAFRHLKIAGDARILDVGCGRAANLLNRLARIGFRNLKGIDPFIESSLITPEGVCIAKTELSDLDETFDLIMFHHSLEHVPFPIKVLADTRARLNRGGRSLIRIPTPSSECFVTYFTDWVNFDAPRHLSLISRQGMEILAKASGFAIECTLDDSTRDQFVGSELYRRDIPKLNQEPAAHFSRKELIRFDSEAERLNSIHRGDSVAFVLRAID
jgi:SAM-dependent methyltransferase